MLIKWLVCSVPEASRDAFDAAQRAWRRIRYVDGLVAQIGGYDASDAGCACVLAVWKDEPSYARFMRDVHDAVVTESGQDSLYDSIEVCLYDVVSRMPGQRPKLHDALTAARLLRVEACRVEPAAIHGFVRAQLDVWTPGMASAKGMFGGVFARRREVEGELLVATAWQDEELHELYADHHLPRLEERAASTREQVTVAGRQVALERHWTVVGVG